MTRRNKLISVIDSLLWTRDDGGVVFMHIKPTGYVEYGHLPNYMQDVDGKPLFGNTARSSSPGIDRVKKPKPFVNFNHLLQGHSNVSERQCHTPLHIN
ncbi:hypothetical protein L596_001469 [Steinernema carpocapsae]|uniref:Uncharacterized protein n=1 Tax=Steinernema carpocapsae TaxID=34508 RepID=A0A4U8ULK1_STECR|nr:hypothetical protein L596_001469 [Steinernema carpocapsae]